MGHQGEGGSTALPSQCNVYKDSEDVTEKVLVGIFFRGKRSHTGKRPQAEGRVGLQG